MDKAMSLPMRGAWIKINAPGAARIREVSLPRRGAWIEIMCLLNSLYCMCVAPYVGSVD